MKRAIDLPHSQISFPSQAEGATGELIQFKILLTYLLQDKEKKADAIAARLKTSSISPAYYYGAGRPGATAKRRDWREG